MQPSRDISRLIEIMARLRTPVDGCPWDLKQTHATLVPYVIEEAYEVADAIERGDVADLRDELGDVLLQVVFHARVAEEAGNFAFGDVVESISAKMLRRHPHVFTTASAEAAREPAKSRTGGSRTGADVASSSEANWDAIKAQERGSKRSASDGAPGLLGDIPVALPGLTRAVKLQTRASSIGFDWNDVRLVLAKIREEVAEIEQELERQAPTHVVADEVGDLLFAVANLARHLGVDPEAAARAANVKFARRFAFIEKALAATGTPLGDATLAEMDSLWDAAKRSGL